MAGYVLSDSGKRYVVVAIFIVAAVITPPDLPDREALETLLA